MQLAALLGLCSCSVSYWERRMGPRFADVDPRATVIKLHLASGEVYVVSGWRLDREGRAIIGVGDRLSPARARLQSGVLSIPLDSVVLFESNRQKQFTSIGVTTTMTLGAIGAIFIVYIMSLLAQGSEYH